MYNETNRPMGSGGEFNIDSSLMGECVSRCFFNGIFMNKPNCSICSYQK